MIKIPLSKKFLLMPRNLSWWVWLVTALCLTVGLMGYSSGFYAAIVISLIQTVVYNLKEKSALTFPVQVRFAYTGLWISPGSDPWIAVLGANSGNICARSLRILLDGPDSLRAPAAEPHGAKEPGSDPADVSDAARSGQCPSWTSRQPASAHRQRKHRVDLPVSPGASHCEANPPASQVNFTQPKRATSKGGREYLATVHQDREDPPKFGSAQAFTLAPFGTAAAQEVQPEAGQTFGHSAARSAS